MGDRHLKFHGGWDNLASFDAAYSVSVIEHIPGDGDGVAMAQLERVLRPGGRLALTFPFRFEHVDEFVEHDLYGQRFTGNRSSFSGTTQPYPCRSGCSAGEASPWGAGAVAEVRG